MSKWQNMELGKVIDFNPSERIAKGTFAKKVPMDKLMPFSRKITGYEIAAYSSGPKFRNGDVLLAKITPCLENGKTAQVDILEEGEVAFGSSEFIVLRENEHSINDYIFYLAQSPAFRKRAIGCMEGTSGRKRVNEGALKLQELPIPDKDIQRKIATVLSSLDTKVELNQKVNAELEAMAKTLYDYWFVQFNFPDRDGKPYKYSGGKMVYNDELKRNIPEGWEMSRVASLLEKVNSNVKLATSEYLSDGKYPIIDQSRDFIVAFTNNEDAVIDGSLVPRIIFGDHTRILKFINFDFVRGADGTQVLLSSTSRMPQHLFFYSLSRIDLSNYGYARHLKFLREQLIILPSIEIAEKFETIARNYHLQIRQNIEQNQKLTQLRDWLLPMLMNGQVTVTGVSEKINEQMEAESNQ